MLAPSDLAAINNMEVSFVICKQNPKLKSDSGLLLSYFSRILAIIFIVPNAHSYDNFPVSNKIEELEYFLSLDFIIEDCDPIFILVLSVKLW
jgi:hypothetical protein